MASYIAGINCYGWQSWQPWVVVTPMLNHIGMLCMEGRWNCKEKFRKSAPASLLTHTHTHTHTHTWIDSCWHNTNVYVYYTHLNLESNPFLDISRSLARSFFSSSLLLLFPRSQERTCLIPPPLFQRTDTQTHTRTQPHALAHKLIIILPNLNTHTSPINFGLCY